MLQSAQIPPTISALAFIWPRDSGGYSAAQQSIVLVNSDGFYLFVECYGSQNVQCIQRDQPSDVRGPLGSNFANLTYTYCTHNPDKNHSRSRVPVGPPTLYELRLRQAKFPRATILLGESVVS